MLEKAIGKLDKWLSTRRVRQAVAVVGQGQSVGGSGYGSNDLAPRKREELIKVSRSAYQSASTAQRIIDIPSEAIAAAGFSVECDDEKMSEWLQDVYERNIDFLLAMDKDCKLNGDVSIPVEVNEIDGSVAFGYIDANNIKNITPNSTNAAEMHTIHLNTIIQPNVFEVIRKENGRYVGNCFHFGHRPLINMTRGIPVLSSVIDSISLFQQFVISSIDRVKLLAAFVWHFIFVDEDDTNKMQQWKEDNFVDGEPPKSGQYFVTNDKFKVEAVAPQLNAADTATMSTMIGKMIFSGSGFPNFYFGEGENTNVATAREIAIPTTWKLKANQREFAAMCCTFIGFIMQVAAEHGMVNQVAVAAAKKQKAQPNYESQPEDAANYFVREVQWKITPNEIYPKDMTQGASVYGQITSSTISARSNKLISHKHAYQAMAVALREIGVNVTAKEVQQCIEDESEQDELDGKVKGMFNGNGMNGNMKPDPVLKDTYSALLRQSQKYYARKPKKNNRRGQ